MHVQLGIQDVVQNKRMEGEEEMEEGKIQGWETTFKSTQGTNCFSTINFPDWLPCNFIRTSYSERNIQETGLIHICPILSSDWVIKMPTNQTDSIYFSNKNEIITHVCRHTKTLESLEVILNVLSWFNFLHFIAILIAIPDERLEHWMVMSLTLGRITIPVRTDIY